MIANELLIFNRESENLLPRIAARLNWRTIFCHDVEI